MRKVGETKIGKITPKPHITYPLIRLPPEFSDVIGTKAQIFETEYEGNKAFLIVVGDVTQPVIKQIDNAELEKRLSKLENIVSKLHDAVFSRRWNNPPHFADQSCRGGDSNPRPPDYESGAPTS